MAALATLTTFTGLHIDPFSLRVDQIDIRDIAHSLSMLCRFNGHCQRYYSVAEHSVHTSRRVPRPFALQALLHDAPESYFSDIPRPIKSHIPELHALEQRLWETIAARFGVEPVMAACVRRADDDMLTIESSALWCRDAEGLSAYLDFLTPTSAERLFLARYEELTDDDSFRHIVHNS